MGQAIIMRGGVGTRKPLANRNDSQILGCQDAPEGMMEGSVIACDGSLIGFNFDGMRKTALAKNWVLACVCFCHF